MRQVTISYDPTGKKTGKTFEMDQREAERLVDEGRAAWADTDPDVANNPRAKPNAKTAKASTDTAAKTTTPKG